MARWSDDVWRICVLRCTCRADAQDAFQETFLKYALSDSVRFESDEHRKAWLIRVALNVCTDSGRKVVRRKEEPLAQDDAWFASDIHEPDQALLSKEGAEEIIRAIRSLDDPPQTPLYLSVVEEMSAKEIANLLNAPINTVYAWISRGKKQVRKILGR